MSVNPALGEQVADSVFGKIQDSAEGRGDRDELFAGYTVYSGLEETFKRLEKRFVDLYGETDLEKLRSIMLGLACMIETIVQIGEVEDMNQQFSDVAK